MADKNKILRQSFYKKPCVVCSHVPSDPCHIKSFGSGGQDEESNLIAMCRQHHSEQHLSGWFRFSQKYKLIEFLLNEKGFYFDGKKLRKNP